MYPRPRGGGGCWASLYPYIPLNVEHRERGILSTSNKSKKFLCSLICRIQFNDLRAVLLNPNTCTGVPSTLHSIVRARLVPRLKSALHHSYHYSGVSSLVQYMKCAYGGPPPTTNNAHIAMLCQTMSMRMSFQFPIFRRPFVLPREMSVSSSA
jgi:hypothetical protein